MNETAAPPAFLAALLSLRSAEVDPRLNIQEVPPPGHLAPWAAAVQLEIAEEDSPDLSGRATLVILFDPSQSEIWGGPIRLVGQARIGVDEDQSTDPLLGEVIWATLNNSLVAAGAKPSHCVGTVTREISQTFGGLELQGSLLHADLRCSWTAGSGDLSADLTGWAEALRENCGLLPHGVTDIEERRG